MLLNITKADIKEWDPQPSVSYNKKQENCDTSRHISIIVYLYLLVQNVSMKN